MVSRALTLTDVATKSSFTDAASIPAWTSQAAAHMQQSDLMKGRVNGAFDSSALTTRAEATQVLMRAVLRCRIVKRLFFHFLSCSHLT
ncbi:S-layer homology domain-containing protein [Paenibacillus sp. ACRSA]|uniref:S-layer homology domain-containing protein n=1 Tax=Paenibacillus sp. ACRSA TaxID=2918211 RepID=UPI001EF438D5|nr:S-layer homology domain-containing protein [Paenibacillus sp. ACRSA]MCG7377979.1 S-layer homology domain-containing protein [Paenibacillus sp. ACRSA]